MSDSHTRLQGAQAADMSEMRDVHAHEITAVFFVKIIEVEFAFEGDHIHHHGATGFQCCPAGFKDTGNAQSATAFFGLPPNRVVEMGAQIQFKAAAAARPDDERAAPQLGRPPVVVTRPESPALVPGPQRRATARVEGHDLVRVLPHVHARRGGRRGGGLNARRAR